MKMKVLALVAGVCLVGGCASIDPYTGQQKTSNTAKGAGIGAVAGAVIGVVSASDDDREKGAITGALAGAAVGGGIGYYMDRQEAALRQRLESSGVRVERIGNEIKLIMPGQITFDTGRAELKTRFFSTLKSVAEVLKEFDRTRIDVSGHTDSTGGNELNQRLSEQRASSVAGFLTNQGVAAGRIYASGYGPRYPVADNGTVGGRAENRRVEIELRAI